MATGPVSKLKRIVDPNRYLWLLFAVMTSLGGNLRPAYAQNCAQCATNAVLDTAVSTGEWLLTKQVNEVNVLFMAARKGKAVSDLSQNDISIRDDNKPPAAIRGFRTERELPLRVGVVMDTSSSVDSRFRFEQAAAGAFFRQAVNRSGDLGFVLGFSNLVARNCCIARNRTRLRGYWSLYQTAKIMPASSVWMVPLILPKKPKSPSMPSARTTQHRYLSEI